MIPVLWGLINFDYGAVDIAIGWIIIYNESTIVSNCNIRPDKLIMSRTAGISVAERDKKHIKFIAEGTFLIINWFIF